MMTFDTFPLSNPLRDTLSQLNYHTLTPVQQKVIPLVLEGKDLIVEAKTGSGKTLAYGVPMIEKIDLLKLEIQALVIVPTRELAAQVTTVLRQLGRCHQNLKIVSLYGGTPVPAQIDSLKVGAHIVVGTPGRLLDHLGKRSLDLSKVRLLVLDEADTMLDLGFGEDVQKTIGKLPSSRQTLLFSATYSDKIKALVQQVLPLAKVVSIADEKASSVETIDYLISGYDKNSALEQVLQYHRPESVIVFVTTKEDAQNLSHYLQEQGHDAVCIHGNLDQIERDQKITLFRNKSSRILVGTDLVARGLDIPKVAMVVNYDRPSKKEQYIHRVGRTARAGEKGVVVNLHYDKERKETRPLCALSEVKRMPLEADFFTLMIYGGRKKKLRPGDIVGSLIKEHHVPNGHIGKIEVGDSYTYVAVRKEEIEKFLKENLSLKIKGKKFRAKVLKL